MNDEFDVTCALCTVKFSGRDRDAVMLAFHGHEKEAHGFMAGKEWYERFIDELLAIPDEDLSLSQLGIVYREAAKRAAGLTSERTS